MFKPPKIFSQFATILHLPNIRLLSPKIPRMKYTKILMISGGLFLAVFSSCSKDDQPTKEETITLPSTLTLNYGEEKDLDIPANVSANATLDFSANENIQIDNTSKLNDKLAQAITIDKAQGKLKVNSALIYPNNTNHVTTGRKLPENYKITFVSGTNKQTIAITVAAPKYTFKGLDTAAAIPYAYVLYNETGASFEMETGFSLTGTSWYLDSKGADSVISISDNKVQFKANAGDPAKKKEQTYNVMTAVTKDGYVIASRQLRVIFIPQIKFFYGTYYPDLDMTIVTNQVYIALSNAYVSPAPTLYPENYKSTFSIVGVEKDGVAFDNKDGILTINETTGAITVKKNTTLTEGSYKLTVKAVTTTGLDFSATMTLIMSKLEE